MADALTLRNLRVLRGSHVCVHDVSWTVEAGTVAAVLGPNGAGKSTLLRGIVGLLPAQGSAQVLGRDVATMSRRERARRVAWLPQESALRTAMPVRDVVAAGLFARRSALGGLTENDAGGVDEAMRAVDVASLSTRPFTQLSGGERRRVLLARALATGAELLLLDEPTAALDLAHALRFFDTIRELTRLGRTVVCVLHDLNDALRFSDLAIVLHHGRQVSSGRTRDALTDDVIRSAWGVSQSPDAAARFDLLESAR